MCLLCVELAKEKMSVIEVAQAIAEVKEDSHSEELIIVLMKHYNFFQVGAELRALEAKAKNKNVI